MRFVEKPNLPISEVKLVILDYRASNDVVNLLKSMNIEIIFTKKNKVIYNAISGHPDVALVHIGKNKFVCEPTISNIIVDQLKSYGAEVIKGEIRLKELYPTNIAYNVAIIGKYVIHNFMYTDRILLEELKKLNYNFINVKQGYTKCMISVIDENSIITSDNGIYKICRKKGIDTLLINEKENISLFEIKHGFIGGATGKLSKKIIGITGEFGRLKSKDLILKFLNKKNISIWNLSKKEIIDIGSILPIMEK
ncbi:MAG: DUF6873 family GME fold protein [Clostridiales bacterium]